MNAQASNTEDKVNGLHTIKGAAKKLNVTQETVRRYIREGRLQAEKVRTTGLREVWGIKPKDLETLCG